MSIPLERVRQKAPALKDRIAQAYHDYGRLCSAHPIACLTFSILTILVLSYPAVVRFKLPVSSPIDIYWNYASEEGKSNFNDGLPDWKNEPAAFYLQQVILRAQVDPWVSTNLTSEQSVRGPLSRSFLIRDILLRIRQVNDACLHSQHTGIPLLPSAGCLLIGPVQFWQSKLQRFKEDPDILSTIFAPECNPSMCIRDILLGVPTGMTGVKAKYQTNRRRSIDFSTTLFFVNYSPILRESMLAELGKHFEILKSPEADEIINVHVFYRPRKYFWDYFPLVASYIVFMVYLYYSARKFEMVSSQWGLALAAMITVVATLTMATGISTYFDMAPTLWGAEVYPYVALVSVVYTPPTLDVSSRIAHGLSQEGFTLCKYFVLELIFLGLGYLTRISEIQEFCRFAFLGLVVDFYMQLFFYAPCLTFDLQRLGVREKQRFAEMLFPTEIPRLKSFAPVSCPARRFFPALFAMKREMKRRLSDSQLKKNDDELQSPLAQNNGLRRRRSISVSKSDYWEADESSTRSSQTESSNRLKFLYFVTRTRIFQRTIMALFTLWVIWLAFFVHSRQMIGTGDSFAASHRLLETAPLQWGEWQRRTFKWWPALFNEYNISLAGRYITFLPPIVLSANISPEDELLKRPTTTTKKFSTQEDETPTLLRRFDEANIEEGTQEVTYRFGGYLDLILPIVFASHRFPIEGVRIADEGRKIISCCHEGRVLVWNSETGEVIVRLNRMRAPVDEGKEIPRPPNVWALCASDDLVYLGCSDGSVEIACLIRNKLIGIFAQSQIGISHIEICSNIIIAARLDGQLDFIRVAYSTEGPRRVSSMRLVKSVSAHHLPLRKMDVYHPEDEEDAALVATASMDHTIKLFNISTGSLCSVLLAHSSPVNSLCIDPPTQTLYSSCEDGIVCTWNMKKGELDQFV
ncbi:hypothetical protein WR25_20439 [Diploscapter pachys]|uniref:Sterol regulatory element-binding protein cleavage-activating protein n=1 Tax=Diploscapter pachys TaxID=2018661 RepID=A0A2A2K797_9BILA|nr:hypothetical protein WR25_20439 [Diploscapter pachys]